MKNPKSKEMFYGEVFEGYKGQEAVKKLLKEKRGYVPSAFYNQKIGEIDLVWGDRYSGIAHIIRERKRDGISIEYFLKDLTDLIENGETNLGKSGRWIIIKGDKKAIVSQDYNGGQYRYLITAMQIRKNKSDI